MRTLVLSVTLLALSAAGCANPYCGATDEPCCGRECGPTLSCVLGSCYSSAGENVPCSPSAPCFAPYVCDLGGGVCIRPCITQEDCPVDRVCTLDDTGSGRFCFVP